jgi:hypothetical protein
MNGIMRNSSVWVQRILFVLLFSCAAIVGIAAVRSENPARTTIAPQDLLRQVTVYELKLEDLPSDMAVTIVKRGTSKPEIHVEKGRERYVAPEGVLAALPSKVREPVVRMFGIPQQPPAEPR